MAIPKIIHYCWLSNEPIPERYQKCIDTWKIYCPDYTFMKWDTTTFDINSNPTVKNYCEEELWAFASDYIRLWALYNYGGIYLDCDVVLCKSFDDLLDYPYMLSLESTECRTIEAAVMLAEKNCPIFKTFLDYYNKETRYGIISSSLLEIVRSNYMFHYIDKPQDFKYDDNVVNILPEEYFSPYDMSSESLKCTENSYCVHMFNRGWLPAIEKFIKIRRRGE